MCNISQVIKERGIELGEIKNARKNITDILKVKGFFSELLQCIVDNQDDLDILNSWVTIAAISNSVEEFEEKISFKE